MTEMVYYRNPQHSKEILEIPRSDEVFLDEKAIFDIENKIKFKYSMYDMIMEEELVMGYIGHIEIEKLLFNNHEDLTLFKIKYGF